jgi:lipopolysaccharide transport system permease protein
MFSKNIHLRKDLTLLYQLTKTSLKLQNENSLLGILWYILGPLFLFTILLFVFSHRLGGDIEHYPLYLLIGIVTWNFFATGTARCMTAFSSNAALIKSLPIKLEVLVLSAVLYTLITHVLEIILFGAFMYWYNVAPTYILLYCIVLMLGFFFTLGAGFFLSSMYVLLRDVEQIWSVLTRAWWFATPIFYVPTPNGPGMLLSKFNPLYYMVHLPRELLIYHRIPPMNDFIALAAFAGVACIVGYSIFIVSRSHFIERL